MIFLLDTPFKFFLFLNVWAKVSGGFLGIPSFVETGTCDDIPSMKNFDPVKVSLPPFARFYFEVMPRSTSCSALRRGQDKVSFRCHKQKPENIFRDSSFPALNKICFVFTAEQKLYSSLGDSRSGDRM